MLKKKSKSNESNEPDFSSLDSAVNELSKQTNELLSSFDSKPEKSEKPKLPKKNAAVHAKTKSFDIIHDPKQKTKLKSTLKVAPKADEAPILEEGEAATVKKPEIAQAVLEDSSASIVHTHKEGILHGGVAPVAEGSDVVSDAESEVDAKAEDASEPETSSPPSKSVSSSAISFEDSKKDDEKTIDKADNKEDNVESVVEPAEKDESESSEEKEDPKEPSGAIPVEEKTESVNEEKSKVDVNSPKVEPATDTNTDGSIKEELKPEAAVEASEKTDIKDEKKNEEPAKDESNSYRGELYANNLVKEAEPKGFEGDGTDKPAVFDTDEYHPELHDWSKLQHKTGSSILVLLLVLVVAGALAYFVLSGQKLPF